VAKVQSADIAIVASPTYKGAYTGLLKLFLDQFATGTGMQGVLAIPLMLGADPGHQMAAEFMLKPVLVELGATVPTPAIFQLDSRYQDDPKLDEWLERWGPLVRSLCSA
jgi:FMN reductase